MPGNFSPPSDAPALSIVIPVRNQWGYTKKCLQSLAQFPPHVSHEIMVVDDCSTDETPYLLKEELRTDGQLRYLRNETAQGFAASCNHGAAEAQGEFLLLLNNDTEALPGWFPPLFETITRKPDIGIVAPLLLFPDGSVQHCGKVWSDLAAHDCQPHHIYYRFPSGHPAVSKSRDFAIVTGACILARRTEFLSLGGFDEEYLNGWEDDDLCYKYTSTGKRIFFQAESRLIHKQSQTLNEKIVDLESRLPSTKKLRELDEILTGGVCSKEDLRLAREVNETFRLIERELEGVRERFLRNRERFFSKWKNHLRRDDTFYSEADGVPLEEALPGIQTPVRPGVSENRKHPTQGENMPLVSIVILTFNRLDVTRECVASLLRHTSADHEVIFVDNGSTDGTVAWLRDLTASNPRYRLVENGINRGFSAGCNQGILAARGEYILLLNNDVIVTHEWLEGLLACFARPKTGIVGPMTNNISGIQQVPGVHYTSLEELEAFAVKFRDRNRHQRIPFRRIVGFCMLFKKSLIDEIGLLDETFGTGNFEDDDLCLRAAIAGFNNVIAGDVFIHHMGSASFRGNNLDYVTTLTDNGKLFREKWSRPVTDENEGKRIIILKTLEKADILFHRADYDGMIETILQEGIRQIPDESRFYLALAGYLLDLCRHKDALDVLMELPANCREETRHVLTGRALLGIGDREHALSEAESALRKNPCSAPTYYILGLIEDAQGRRDRAQMHWEKALECDPGYGEPFTALGILEIEKNQEKALVLLERGFLLSPLATESILRYHTAVNRSGEFQRAEGLFREMHRIYPQHRTIHFLLIDLLIRQGKTEEALTQIEEACVVFGVNEGMLAAGLELRRDIGPMVIPDEKRATGRSVSLCMIMKNEQDNLPRCLKSLKPLVDEIIITDTGSTDSSRAIAELFGARLLDFPWNGDFSAARNVSLERAAGNWILVMDADEVISELDYRPFLELVAAAPRTGAAYDVVTRNYMFNINLEKWRPNDGRYPNDEAGAGWTPSNKVRLFPNLTEIRFENPVHEMVDISITSRDIPILQTDIPVHHYGYLDKERQKRKGEEYYLLGKKKLEQSGENDFRALCELAVQAGGIERYQEAVELWERVLTLNPSYPLALFNLGYALLQMGRFHESRAASAKAMESDPGLFEAVNNFAICEICVGSTEKATQTLKASLERRPDDANTLVMLAVAHICSGDKDSAVSIFRHLLDKNVCFAEFVNEASRKLSEAGKSKFAKELLETALILQSGNDETGRLLRDFMERT